jgi:radical SAM superfamily enzyme YgiQ (UPF0313 family)
MIVGKVAFTSSLGCYGLELCLQEAYKRKDWQIYDVDIYTAAACDVLLVTLTYYADILMFEKFLRDTGLKNRKSKPIIIAGGIEATLNPELISQMADYVFIGDGEDHTHKILDYISKGKDPQDICKYLYKQGDKNIPEPYNAPKIKPIAYFQKRYIVQAKEQILKKTISKNEKLGQIYRVEIARGCKSKCPFCVMSGLKPYREASYEDIIKAASIIPDGAIVSFFAPDTVEHSHYDKIIEYIKLHKFRNNGLDTRLKNLPESQTQSATIGIEGVSDKLRKIAGKPYKKDYILEQIGKYVEHRKAEGMNSLINIYYIADLPGEKKEDYEELLDFFRDIERAEWSRNLSIRPVLNPLSPKPFTALYNSPIHPLRDYMPLWQKICRGGTGKGKWGFRVVEQTVWSPFDRVLDAVIHRGKEKAYKIISKLKSRYLTHYVANRAAAFQIAKQIISESEKIGLTKTDLFNTENLGWEDWE